MHTIIILVNIRIVHLRALPQFTKKSWNLVSQFLRQVQNCFHNVAGKNLSGDKK